MQRDSYYITTPIYYVNDVPHIGHAYTTLICDVLARAARLSGRDTYFLTGTDEHGQKVEKSARSKGVDPQSFTDQVSQRFRDLGDVMNYSNDDFIRTTEQRHKEAVAHLWQKLIDTGNIYLDKYSGWYSVRDEAFYTEKELTEDGLAPTGAPVEWVEEESYFFALSKWQEPLLEFYAQNPDFVYPRSRMNEVVSFVEGGLQDLSVSRSSLSWGIPVPGDDKHVIYVWLDALTNYLSAIEYPEQTSHKFTQFWPANIHVVGKDILRFHAVYWPAFLMAAGIELPKKILAHGWWTNEGQKISKSIGNVINPLDLVEEFGLENVRYFMMKEVLLGNDGNYSREVMINRVNSELVNKIGNLVQRSLKMVQKNFAGKVPARDFALPESQLLLKTTYDLQPLLCELSDSMQINSALDAMLQLATDANIYIDHMAPWALKDDMDKMAEVLSSLVEVIRCLAIALQPFVPVAASKILDMLNIAGDLRRFEHISESYRLDIAHMINEPEIVFSRIQDKVS